MSKEIVYRLDLSRNLSRGFHALNAGIDGIPANTHPPFYIIREVFTTLNGSWEPGDSEFSVPQWARDKYLRSPSDPDYFGEAGAATHLFARVVEQGEPINATVSFWSDGTGVETRETGAKTSMWANFPISQGFNPNSGVQGPWKFKPTSHDFPAETFVGGGLPYGHHVSTFVTWEYIPDGGGTKPPPAPETYAEYVENYVRSRYGDSARNLDDIEILGAIMIDAGRVASSLENSANDTLGFLGSLCSLYRSVAVMAIAAGIPVEDLLDLDNADREI